MGHAKAYITEQATAICTQLLKLEAAYSKVRSKLAAQTPWLQRDLAEFTRYFSIREIGIALIKFGDVERVVNAFLNSSQWYFRNNLKTLTGVEFGEMLGQGSFSTAYVGKWQNQELVVKLTGKVSDADQVKVYLEDAMVTCIARRHRGETGILRGVKTVPKSPSLFSFNDKSGIHRTNHHAVVSVQTRARGVELSKATTQMQKDDGVWGQLLQKLLHGLTRIHSSGIAHLDIKPANLMLAIDSISKFDDEFDDGTTSLTPTYIDFGGAKVCNTTDQDETQTWKDFRYGKAGRCSSKDQAFNGRCNVKVSLTTYSYVSPEGYKSMKNKDITVDSHKVDVWMVASTFVSQYIHRHYALGTDARDLCKNKYDVNGDGDIWVLGQHAVPLKKHSSNASNTLEKCIRYCPLALQNVLRNMFLEAEDRITAVDAEKQVRMVRRFLKSHAGTHGHGLRNMPSITSTKTSWTDGDETS
jgi:serine/threonine protein kinase